MSTSQLHGVLRHLRGLRDAQVLSAAADSQLLESFARDQDEAPFTALVRRHGPMVWSVSRRVLPHLHDAEDVFQATFLLLARKARSIRKSGSVGSWLHGVAHRLALKARSQQVRRQVREKQAGDMRQHKRDSSLTDVQAALDAALGNLPEKYRAALVLCYLEGQTYEEAARHVGCPLATLRTRLARGRKLLRTHLTSHGLTLSTAGVAALLIASAAPAAMPVGLARAAAQAALPFALGQSAASLCSPQVAVLVEKGLQAMSFTNLKTTAAMLLVLTFFAGAAALAQRQTTPAQTSKTPPVTLAEPPTVQAKTLPAKLPEHDFRDRVAFSGRVLGPDGRPIARAKIYVSGGESYLQKRASPPVYGTSEEDGGFQFTVPRAKFHGYYIVTAAAPNYGPGWAAVSDGRRRDNLTLRLVPDEVPINALLVDLQGKPVAGATLTVYQITAGYNEDLEPWLAAVQAKTENYNALQHNYLRHYTTGFCPQATTDRTGRLTLRGVGRNRIAWAVLEGPDIAIECFQIVTRPGKTLEVTEIKARPEDGVPRFVAIFYGASFQHVTVPGRPIVGVVRDQQTGKPLAGASVLSAKMANNPYHRLQDQELVQTKTDAEGHFRLTGMPKGKGNVLRVRPPVDQSYLTETFKVPDPPGIAPVTLDVDLKQGIWIEGKVTDKMTGKPCQGAVEYLPMGNNPSLADHPGFDLMHMEPINKDGSYRIVGLPGAGLIGVWDHSEPYLRADSREDEFGAKQDSLQTWAHIFTSNYSALARINPDRGDTTVKRDITLDPGWSFKGRVLGPDGRLLSGAILLDMNRFNAWKQERLAAAEFTGWFNPQYPHEILLHHPDNGLVGVVQPPKKYGGSITARLTRGASITGRLVDARGMPRTGVELLVMFKPKGWGGWFDYFSHNITTDSQGRFRVDRLLPGFEYCLADDHFVVLVGDGLRAGETKDIGEVRAQLEKE
jgi:RNA polymerase sigma factor (sigma-70 family)